MRVKWVFIYFTKRACIVIYLYMYTMTLAFKKFPPIPLFFSAPAQLFYFHIDKQTEFVTRPDYGNVRKKPDRLAWNHGGRINSWNVKIEYAGQLIVNLKFDVEDVLRMFVLFPKYSTIFHIIGRTFWTRWILLLPFRCCSTNVKWK